MNTSRLDMPVLNMISYPTPLEEMPRLRQALRMKPRLFIKRDDLTQVGLGGNKTRKLDYVMADAKEKGADTVITWGGAQSNHCRQTLCYARRLNMDCHLVLNGRPDLKRQGNLFLFDIFGAALHFQPEEDRCMADCLELAKELKGKGKKPYVIGIGASSPLGSLGYIRCARELSEQAAALSIHITDLFCATGSGGTQAGLEIGRRLYLPGCRVHGVSVGTKKERQRDKVAKLIQDTIGYFALDMKVAPEELRIYDEYIGMGYAVPSKAGNEAIQLTGRTEAVLLDPVYTGKAMAGLMDQLERGALTDADAVVFLHTGGGPAIFNFVDTFQLEEEEA